MKIFNQGQSLAREPVPVALISTAFEIGSTFVDVGGEIIVGRNNQIGLFFDIDRGDSVNIQIRILHKHAVSGTDEYREIYLGNPTINKTTINLNDYEIANDVDQKFKINIPISMTTPVIQIQAKDDSDGTGQIDSLTYILSYAD